MTDETRDLAAFQSARFAPVLPEECQVNPQVYGAELAFWLGAELARQNVVTSYPQSEDWGWYIEFRAGSGAEFAIDCGNVAGERDQWLLSVRRFARKMYGRDKPEFSDADPLIETIRNVLEAEASVSNLRWLYGNVVQ